MKVIRGKYAGATGRVHQFANDWMMLDLDDGRQGVIVSPAQVQLDPVEQRDIAGSPHVGTFWQEWRLNDDGTFAAVRVRRPRTAS